MDLTEATAKFRLTLSFADLSINSTEVELLSFELLCDKKRNTLINALHRQPMGLAEPFEKFLNDIFNKINTSNKMFHIVGEFNLNVLDHDNCKKYRIFQIYCTRII